MKVACSAVFICPYSYQFSSKHIALPVRGVQATNSSKTAGRHAVRLPFSHRADPVPQ
jgi:hypothetical protein